MPRLLDRMPFFEKAEVIAFKEELIRVRANQIIMWVNLTAPSDSGLAPVAPPFPAILDTGHTHSFAIQRRHLAEWAGLPLDRLRESGSVREKGERILLYSARLWVRRNSPGKFDQLADADPFLVGARLGIAVYPTGDFPRLPIFGLRAIGENKLILKIDGARRSATLRTRISIWPFNFSWGTRADS